MKQPSNQMFRCRSIRAKKRDGSDGSCGTNSHQTLTATTLVEMPLPQAEPLVDATPEDEFKSCVQVFASGECSYSGPSDPKFVRAVTEEFGINKAVAREGIERVLNGYDGLPFVLPSDAFHREEDAGRWLIASRRCA